MVGSLIMTILCTFAAPSVQISIVGSYVSILAGLLLAFLAQDAKRDQHIELLFQQLGLLRQIAQDSVVYQKYEKIVRGIAETLRINDPLFYNLALNQLSILGETTDLLSRGKIEFRETEAWRTTYEELLKAPDITHYYSVALVENDSYWQDEPGKASIDLNYRLQDEKGLNIERTAIVAESIWPREAKLPRSPILEWIEEQHNHGIWMELVRQSSLSNEPDVVKDIGIYGERAVGTQKLDKQSRTTNYVLSFDPDDILFAKQCWERLRLYSVSFRELLDRL